MSQLTLVMHPHVENDGAGVYLMAWKKVLLSEKNQVKYRVQGRVPFQKRYVRKHI